MSQKVNNKIEPRDQFFVERPVEVRNMEDGTCYVRGYAALYNSRSRKMVTYQGIEFVEEIAPGAFDGTDFSELECRMNHDLFLCKTPTLKFGVDGTGLWYEYKHDPLDPDHMSAYRKIARGDIRGSSFMFPAPGENDQEVTTEGGVKVRMIKRFRKLYDLGPVSNPAYPASTAFARSLDAAYETNPNPTIAQQMAGNFKKGRVKVSGMEIAIENPKGFTRKGVAKDGTEWAVTMTAHYGYILGADAADGDDLDVFLSDDAEGADCVFVVDQIDGDGNFDEHKCIIGPTTQDDARNLYLSNYSPGWTGLGAISFVPMECFRAWAMDGKPKRTPLRYRKGMDETRSATEADGSETEANRNLTEADRSKAEANGSKPETNGTSSEANGTSTESNRNTSELPTEANGSSPESDGSSTEPAGTSAEGEGSETEAQRSIINRRKREIRQFLAVRPAYS